MPNRITISVEAGGVAEKLAEVRDYLTSSAGGVLVAGIGVETKVKRHIAKLAASRHDTAQRLGATPSSHYDASLVELTDATGGSAKIRVGIPGISRAYHDVTIVPREKKALAIPIHALAYGVRAAELRLRMETFIPKKSNIIFGKKMVGRGKKQREEVIPLYVLKTSVHQRQDSTLMPTSDEIRTAAIRAMTADLRARFRK